MAGTSGPGAGRATGAPRRRRKGWQPHPAPTHSPESTHRPAAVAARPSFGVDSPSLVIAAVGVTIALTFAGVFIGGPAGLRWSALFWLAALGGLAVTTAMFLSSFRGKAALWDEVLDGMDLRGDEQALDAGCGRGLVLVALARRVPEGHVTGVDVWRNRDQSGNAPAATALNADVAGVADRVTVTDGDVRRLPLPDGAFDVVTAGLVLHHLATPTERKAAVGELVRVARPGGRVVVVDRVGPAELEAALRRAGAERVEVSGRRWLTYPPTRVVTAWCPAAPGS